MKKSITFMLILIFLLGKIGLMGQGCGTVAENLDLRGLDQLYKNKSSAESQILSSYTVRVFVHILQDDNGTNPAATKEMVGRGIQHLKDAFENTGLCFGLVGIDTINHTLFNQNMISPTYWGFYFTNQGAIAPGLLVREEYPANCVNVFVVRQLTSDKGESLCGAAFDIPSRFMLIESGCLESSSFAHEMGHCLGLVHTHETVFGAELVNGSNCYSAGDKLCDTPADPNLSGKVDGNCQYTGTDKDANGDFYKPFTHNVMSYSVKACRTVFTPEQIGLMNAWLKLSNTPLEHVKADENIELSNLFFVMGKETWLAKNNLTAGDLNGAGNVFIAGAARVYLMAGNHITLKPGFEAAPNIQGSTTAYINRCSNVAPNSTAFVYRAVSPAPSRDQPSAPVSAISITPNPFTTSTSIAYLLSEDAPVAIRVFNATGALVATPVPAQQQPAGEHSCVFEAGQLPPGVYLLVVQAGDSRATKRLVLTR